MLGVSTKRNQELLKEIKVSILLIMIFAGLLLLWVLASYYSINFIRFIMIWVASLILILENKNNITKSDVLIGIILGALSIPSHPLMGASTIISFIAAMSVFNKANNKILAIKTGKKNVLVTLIIILVIGGVLGVLNAYSAINLIQTNVSFKLQWILDAMKAGITEEVLFRFLFFAICVRVTKDSNFNKFQKFICYLIVIIHHTLVHFVFTNFNISNVIALSLFFGLPFALLQMKRDLFSAMGSHALVDLIRFCIFGV